MKILSWNIRGLNAPSKQRAIREVIQKYKPDMVLIQETKVREKAEEIRRKIWKEAEMVVRKAEEKASGGLWSLWNPKTMEGEAVSISRNQITTKMWCKENKEEVMVTNIYAPNEREKRRQLWEELGRDQEFGRNKGIMAGDFNTTLYLGEKKGGTGGLSEGMLELGELIRELGLEDMEMEGRKYTWTNRRIGQENIQARLDRVLVTREVMSTGNLRLVGLPRLVSDHNPLLFSIGEDGRTRGCPFRFEMMWTKEEELRGKIQEWWNNPVYGKAMYRVAKKLKKVKMEIKKWNKERFRDIHERKEEVEKRIEDLEKIIQEEGASKEKEEEEQSVMAEYLHILEKEEIH